MKAFEEWKSKNCENKGCPFEASCNGCEMLWRAALEWVLKQELIDDDGRFINSYVIREELGDT